MVGKNATRSISFVWHIIYSLETRLQSLFASTCWTFCLDLDFNRVAACFLRQRVCDWLCAEYWSYLNKWFILFLSKGFNISPSFCNRGSHDVSCINEVSSVSKNGFLIFKTYIFWYGFFNVICDGCLAMMKMPSLNWLLFVNCFSWSALQTPRWFGLFLYLLSSNISVHHGYLLSPIAPPFLLTGPFVCK